MSAVAPAPSGNASGAAPEGLIMGPVLLFRGWDDAGLHLRALSVTAGPAGPGPLTTEAGEVVAPRRLLASAGRVLWRSDFTLPPVPGRSFSYRLGGRSWEVTTPPREGPRIAFAACNGTEAPEAEPRGTERMRLWRDIWESHCRHPFHLLVQGGDQVYADPVWDAHPALAPFRKARHRAGAARFDSAMLRAVRRFYFELYTGTWSHPDLAPLLARIPSAMMWDDHDIFDGWGSWPPRLQESPLYQGLYAAAREAFAAFQLGEPPEAPLSPPFLDAGGRHYGWLQRVGGVALWAPDLRSERTQSRVLGDQGWRDVHAALSRARGCRQLFVVSTVPLLNTPMRFLERLHFAVPGHQYFQDDLRDQWQSYAHQREWARLIDALLRFRAETGARVSVLSGEIHMGAWGLLEAPEGRLHQLVSSGVVHPPPPPAAVRIMDWMARGERSVRAGARYRLRPLPGLGGRYLAARNWLLLDPVPAEQMYRAVWHAEGGRSEPLLLD